MTNDERWISDGLQAEAPEDRAHVVRRLDPERHSAVLRGVARADRDARVRIEALARLLPDRDDDVIADAALYDRDTTVRAFAVTRLDAEEHHWTLALVFRTDPVDEVRQAVVEKTAPGPRP